MKKLIVFSIMASSAMTAFSQGTVLYNNLVTGLRAPILIAPANNDRQVQGQPTVVVAQSTPIGTANYGAGAVGASGTGFTAELWAGASAASLTMVPGSQVPLRTGAFAGYITSIATLAVPQVGLNGNGTFQLRAWDNANGTVTSWSAAIAGSLGRGESLPFANPTGGGGTPATLPSNLAGLTSFNIYVVPEPSLIALGALGLGALLLRRRKA